MVLFYLVIILTTRSVVGEALEISSTANPEDTFNYGETVGNNFGPKDWGKVT